MNAYDLNLHAMSPYSNDSLERAKESMEHYFEMCVKHEQGINTKESVRYRRICDELERRGASVRRAL